LAELSRPSARGRDLADKKFTLLKADPRHGSIRLKKIGRYWSARVGLYYRVLAKERPDGFVWFWIGPHSEYDRFIRGL
jgi:hypothetical protein